MNSTKDDAVAKYRCKNCGAEHTLNYCSNCGQKRYTRRFTIKSFFAVIMDAFNIERGFLYTAKMLFVDPGKVINEYLNGRTKRYYNPLKYLLIIAGVNALLVVWFKIFDANVDTVYELIGVENEQLRLQQKLTGYMKQYLNVIVLFMLPFNSLASKWYYGKHKLLYGEHLIIYCFLYAQYLLISMATYPLYIAFPMLYSYIMLIGFITIVVYYSYALFKLFRNSVFKSFLGALTVNFGGMLLFLIFYMLIAFIAGIVISSMGYNIKDLV